MSTAGVPSGEGREVVTLNVLKDADSMTGHEVAFLMDTGAECNLLPLDVYKGVTGDLDLNSLHSLHSSEVGLILANGYEQPIEGKATLYATRNGHTHKIQVSVVNSCGYEPVLSKKSMLEMNLIKILDCN